MRTTWALTAIGLALVAMSTSSYIFGDPIDAPAGSAQRTATAIDIIGTNTMLVLVVGVLITTTEFRHATIGHTLQLTPSRTRILTAKLTTGGAYAVGFFAASVLLVAATVLLAASLNGVQLAAGGEITTALWHNLVAMVLTGVLGVAVGALMRSQVVAITASLAWMFLVENLAAAIDYRIGRWFPFQALNAIFIARTPSPSIQVRSCPSLPRSASLSSRLRPARRRHRGPADDPTRRVIGRPGLSRVRWEGPWRPPTEAPACQQRSVYPSSRDNVRMPAHGRVEHDRRRVA